MTEPSDLSLLARFRAGETQAFAALVERHQSALLRHARALVGTGAAFEDVVQETFLKLAQNPPALAASESGDAPLANAQLSAWLHKVTRNLCMDVIRSETRRKTREQDVAQVEATQGGQAALEAEDTRAVVERKLGTLPQEQREVLVLRLLGEKTYREIAEITGKKIGTVGWLVSAGLKRLSAELEPLLNRSNERGTSQEQGMGFGLVQGELS